MRLSRKAQPAERPNLRRATTPTGRRFDLQDHRVRAAVREALKDVACASGTRSRDNAGPIRAQPRYRQFDLPIRRRRMGSCKGFFGLDHSLPDP